MAVAPGMVVKLPPLDLAPAGAASPIAGPAVGDRCLVIVESPSKAKTISGYLNSEKDAVYKGIEVLASVGHIRDLPVTPKDSQFGFDLSKGTIQYEIPDAKAGVVAAMVKAAKKADKIYLATDPDREGEAISWHIATILQEQGIPAEKIGRTAWNEVTREGVKAGLSAPRTIDMDMVAAAVYRRVSDRLEGYTESPWLTQKLRGWMRKNLLGGDASAKTPSLSAGRVQNSTLYLLAVRHGERVNHVARSYGAVRLALEAGEKPFNASLVKVGQRTVVGPEKEGKSGTILLTSEAMNGLPLPKAGDKLEVARTETKAVKVPPKAPFVTTTLQVAAFNALGLAPEETMRVAQTLFQKGQITYHRSDSPNISEAALVMARDHIARTFGEEFLPKSPRQYKADGDDAQEAHECIRPAHLEPSHAKEQAKLLAEAVAIEGPVAEKLLDLITRRFLASQMPDKIHDATVAHLTFGSGDEALTFKANGNVTRSEGWTRIFAENEGEEGKDKDKAGKAVVLPPLAKGGVVIARKAETTMKKTTPPPAYTEATLVEEMGNKGVGRPSTVAATLKTLVSRGYMAVGADGTRKGVVSLTPLGLEVFENLQAELGDQVKPEHTASLEKELHGIAGGKTRPEEFLGRVYGGLKAHFPDVLR